MTGMLHKGFSKLMTPLKRLRSFKHDDGHNSSSCNHNNTTMTISCTPNHTTATILAQLQDCSKNKHVTHLVLREMIQRSDNVQLFRAIEDLVVLDRSKYCFHKVRSIHLLEPHVHSANYRRWVYKKANFLQRIRREARARDIEVTIHGTLIMDGLPTPPVVAPASAAAAYINHQQQKQPQPHQNVSSWLGLLSQLPSDPDITSLWISIREDAIPSIPSCTTYRREQQDSAGRKWRSSQLELLQSPVQQIFQALVELFNADTRPWHFIHCHVLYHPSSNNESSNKANDNDNHHNGLHPQQTEQTQSLLEVAELFQIPLQVQWQPIMATSSRTLASSSPTAPTSATSCQVVTRSTSFVPAHTLAATTTSTSMPASTTAATTAATTVADAAMMAMEAQKDHDDEHTSTTVDFEGSSGAFMSLS